MDAARRDVCRLAARHKSRRRLRPHKDAGGPGCGVNWLRRAAPPAAAEAFPKVATERLEHSTETACAAGLSRLVRRQDEERIMWP